MSYRDRARLKAGGNEIPFHRASRRQTILEKMEVWVLCTSQRGEYGRALMKGQAWSPPTAGY